VNRLRPFFSYFGSKWRLAPKYPPPKHINIIEPFCGSAPYSLNYFYHRVHLFDLNPTVCGTWDYLIRAKPSEIRRLPVNIEHVDEMAGWPEEAKWLVGWWMHKCSTRPYIRPSAWMRKYAPLQDGVYWSEYTRERIAGQVMLIDHWTVECREYSRIPDQRATWFVDAPYDCQQGEHYTHGRRDIEFAHLARWCRTRSGQVIVCEGEQADWMDFRPFRITHGQRGHSQEMIWTNMGTPIKLKPAILRWLRGFRPFSPPSPI
jgi:site-specific DNA-adenine methylase